MTDVRTQAGREGFEPSGDADIDRVRKEVAAWPTTAESFAERALMMSCWISLLQRRGISLVDYIPVFDALQDAARSGNADLTFEAIDRAFGVLARIQSDPPPEPTVCPPSAPDSGEAGGSSNWPVYGANAGHTASVPDSGPSKGRIAWISALGLGWYARPAVEGGRVYVVSPGIREMLNCLELETGERVWRTSREWPDAAERLMLGGSHVAAQSYRTPCAACTPVIRGGCVILAELGAQSLQSGARWLTWIDAKTGNPVRREPTGDECDYRIGYAALAGDDRFLVYPGSRQRIQDTPPSFTGQNRIVCRRVSDGELEWDFFIGQTFCEPVLHDGRVITGTADGTVFCLNTVGASAQDGFGISDRRRVAWSFKAGGGVNMSPAADGERVIFGANDGAVYSLAAGTGKLDWKRQLPDIEPRSFRFASTPAVSGGRVYIGTSARRLCCLDLDGVLVWSVEMPDWIRSRPVVVGNRVFAAALDGSLSCVEDRGRSGRTVWTRRIDEYPIFADLVEAEGRILVCSSGLTLFCVDAENGEERWRHRLLPHAKVDGREIPSDDLASGGFCQSKPTAAGGKVFIGGPSRFVKAFDSRTGRELWRFETGAAVSGAPAYSRGRVFFGQQGGEDDFYCVKADTGGLVWKQATGWVWSSANVVDLRLYIPGVDGYVYCLEEETGRIIWRRRTGRACHPEPPAEGDLVFFGSWDHNVYACNRHTGELAWQFHTGGTPDSGAPVAAGGRLYVPMGGKRVCCLDQRDGSVIWEHTVETGCMNASPCLWGDRLYISVNVRSGAIPCAARIRCLDAGTGRALWEHPGGGITGPAIAQGRVYTASTADNWFRCFDGEGGAGGPAGELWRAAMADRVYESVPCIYGKMAFVLCEDARLYAFE